MPEPTLIVLMIDGISAALPGPYGNTTVETPALNLLASQSHVFDFCFSDSPQLDQIYPQLWPQLATRPSTIVSDCPDVLNLATEAEFETIIDAAGEPKSRLANSVAETQAADFFVQALAAAHETEPGGICWLHHRGLTGPWDAPYELRCSFADEDDPAPPQNIDRPIGTFDSKSDDPDELLGYQQCAYAQLTVIDQLLDVFLEQLQQVPNADELMLVFTSPRGYPLGEHGIVGSFENLFNETIHVPLMIRLPSSSPSDTNSFFGRRHRDLIQLSNLNPLLQRLLDNESENETGEVDAVASSSINASVGNLIAMQTESWKLIVDAENTDDAMLFAKPDDRWEVNDVSRRCVDIVEAMIEVAK